MPNPELEATNAAREPGPQPDPALKEGPASSSRKWAVSLIIAAVLLAVMYGITTHRADTQDEQRHSEVQTSQPNTTTPGQALPGGRTTGNAPALAAPKTSTQGSDQ